MRLNHRRISVIQAFQHHLSSALSRAARSIDANRRRFLTFGGSAIGAAIVVPVRATAARVVAQPHVATCQMLGYRETRHVRHYYSTARL